MDGLQYVDSKFRLAILASKRAKQLVNGAKRKLESDAENPLLVAIEEIQNGLIPIRVLDKSEFDALDVEAYIPKLNNAISEADDESSILAIHDEDE